MDLYNFAILLFIYLIGFKQIESSASKIKEMGLRSVMFIVAVYGIVLICATIYAIATHFLPWWGVILAGGLGALPRIFIALK